MLDETSIASERADTPPEGMSQLKFFSVGKCAVSKELGSRFLEVTTSEVMPMANGLQTEFVTTETVTGVSADGSSYSDKTQSTDSIRAEWLPLGAANRITPPDVRYGEAIMLYKFADADKYYWTTLNDDLALRKRETVIYAYSNVSKEGEKPTANSMLFFEISTHKKHVHMHMPNNDGEACGFDTQFNSGKGFWVIEDTQGGFFKRDVIANSFRIDDGHGNFIDLTKGKLTVNLAEEYILRVPKTTETTERTQTGDATVIGNTTTNGDGTINGNNTISQMVTMGAFAAVGGGGTTGGGTISGAITVSQGLTVTGNLGVTGSITATGTVSGSNI